MQQKQPVEEDSAGSRDVDMQDEGMQANDVTKAQPMDPRPLFYLPAAASEDILAPNLGAVKQWVRHAAAPLSQGTLMV